MHTIRKVIRLSAAAALTALCALPAVAAAKDAQMAQGKALFLKGTVPNCAICHTLEAAGAQGAVGPVLDELKPDAARVAKALRNGLGQMPSFKDKLTDAQIEALSLYVAKASGGQP